jgi:hypothetical protein
MIGRKVAAGGFVFGIVVVSSMVLGVAAPAQAVGGLDDPYNLLSYVLDAKSSVLASPTLTANSGNTAAALSAWNANFKKIAAASVGANRAMVTTGVVPLEQAGELIPISDYPAGSIGAQVGTRLPATGWTNWAKITPGATVALTAAMLIYDQRASISQIGSSWLGIDANAAVCSNTPFSSGFLNYITGQDCSGYGFASDYVANTGMPAGWGVSGLCVPGTTTCLTITGESWAYLASSLYCVTWTGAAPVSSGGTPPTATNFTINLSWAGGFYNNGSVFLKDTNHWGAPSNGGMYGACHSEASTGLMPPNTGLVLNGGQTSAQPPITSASVRNTSTGATSAAVAGAAYDPTPNVVTRCTYTMTDGTVVSKDSSSYKENTGALPPDCPAVPAGKVVGNIATSQIGPGINYGLTNNDTTPAFRETAINQPQCLISSCVLDLKDLTSGKSCFTEADTCDGWISDPNYDSKYQCSYGGQNQVKSECYAYANVFNQAKRLAGDAYADPATGDDPGAGTSESLGTSEMGSLVRDPDTNARDCMGGSSPNASWIAAQLLKPIQCGLEWAFVPSAAATFAVGESMRHAFDERAPGQLITMISGWHFTANMGGCSRVVPYDPGAVFRHAGTGSTTLWNVCPGSTYEWLGTTSKIVVGLSFAVMVFLSVKRSIAGTVDYR